MFSPAAGRQRDLLPLPPVELREAALCPFSVRGRACTRHRREDETVSEVIWAINQLGGCDTNHSAGSPSTAQAESIEFIRASVARFGPPPAGTSGRRALRELCSSAPTYGGESTRTSYSEELVSWPPEGTVAVDPLSLTSGPAHDLLQQWETALLRPPGAAEHARRELGLTKPYSDPVLIRSRPRYGRFLQALARRGMVEYGPEADCTIGCFFVRKSGGKQRIIFDTRLVNANFVPPLAATLPTAGAFAALECEVPFEVHQGDVCNAFYHVALPAGLRAHFRLPSTTAGDAGVRQLGGRAVTASTRLTPRLKILPMGWAWSL